MDETEREPRLAALRAAAPKSEGAVTDPLGIVAAQGSVPHPVTGAPTWPAAPSNPLPAAREEVLRDLDYLIDDVVADAYVRGVEGLSTEVSPKSTKTLHDAIAAALLRQAPAAPNQEAVDGFTSEDFSHTASLLRSGHEVLRQKAFSNNYNIILAALDRASPQGQESGVID